MKGFNLFPTDGNQVEVRKLIPDDLPELEELCCQHANFENGAWVTDTQRLRRWRSSFFGSNPKAHAWVAESDIGLCGYATVTVDYSTWSGREFAHLDCLFVNPSFRGMGIGKRLLKRAVIFAIENCEGRMEWQTPEWNDAASKFYEAIGATWTRKRRFLLTIESERR